MDPRYHVPSGDGSSHPSRSNDAPFDALYPDLQNVSYAVGWNTASPYPPNLEPTAFPSPPSAYHQSPFLPFSQDASPQALPLATPITQQPDANAQFTATPPVFARDSALHLARAGEPYGLPHQSDLLIHPDQAPAFDFDGEALPLWNQPIQPASGPELSRGQSTVAPRALQNVPPDATAESSNVPDLDGNLSGRPLATVGARPPPGQTVGNFTVLSREALERVVKLDHRPRAAFVFTSSEPINIEGVINNAIPKYVPRMSRNQIRRLMAEERDDSDLTVTSRRSKKHLAPTAKKELARVRLDPAKIAESAKNGNVATPDSSSFAESDEDSDDDSVDEDTVTPDLPSLPPTKPEDPIEAVKYDTTKILWRSSRRGLTGEEIKTAMGDYWNLLKPIRDKWNDLEKADGDKGSDAPTIKDQIAEQRALVAASVSAALQEGHPDIVQRLGDIHPLVHILCQKVLRDRVKAEDYGGSITADTLELLSRFVTLPAAILEKLTFPKLAVRFAKKGTDQTKALVKKIEANAEALKRKEAAKPATTIKPVTTTAGAAVKAEAKTSVKGEAKIGPKSELKLESKATVKPANKPAAAGTPTAPASLAGAKRLRPEPDTGDSQPAKKITPSSTAKRPVQSTTNGKPMAEGATNGTKSKAKHVTAPPNKYFAGLASASKLKSTPNVLKPGASVEKKPSMPTATMSAPRPVFSLSDTLARLNKPDEPEVSAKPVNPGPPETEEEKRKRLRKEQRRKLRVTFKPADSLEQIRYFTHDQAEEVDRPDNLLRDAGDATSEGLMFKQHKEIDLGDEDDEPVQREETLRPWYEPTPIDFSVIDEKVRAANVVTRGGLRPVESPESLIQAQREANELMVVYTDLESIPPTPRSPPPMEDVGTAEEVPFGAPSAAHQWYIDRLAQRQAQKAAQKAAEKPAPQAHALHPNPATQATGTPDIAAIIDALNAQSAARPTPPPSAAPMTELEKIFAAHAAKWQAAAPPPVAPAPVAPTNPAAALQNVLSALAATQQPAQQQRQAQQHQPTQAPAMPFPISAQSGYGNQAPQSLGFDPQNLQAVLAQLGQGAASAVTQPNYGFSQQQSHVPASRSQSSASDLDKYTTSDGDLDYEALANDPAPYGGGQASGTQRSEHSSIYGGERSTPHGGEQAASSAYYRGEHSNTYGWDRSTSLGGDQHGPEPGRRNGSKKGKKYSRGVCFSWRESGTCARGPDCPFAHERR
ncbi:MAG: hypothetical protein M1838_004167 [Thelocarpon superellum]|nr:MAG: hypothetical protein M1838_004167 [Thelocarpon superellum]